MYQALYRKWRPQVFADVVGQDHITTTLMNEIRTGRHSHAYLFTGSRGTGKTTCAKIFAKAVNCEHPVNGDPCGECETCKGIDNGSVMDVIEIDAASNNGVDNIRDIRDEANFTPVGGKYRVYIIDEVHMLSTGAFNALLKTLEEPPEHVKFILATTEVHKLPATILSRCQRFDFKRITPEDIAKRLAYVAEREELTLDADAAMLIARLADGALRDALSIMDQCIGHSRNITTEVVNETVGLAGKDYLFSLSEAILNKDSASALEKINELHNRSCDMERLCNELTNHFRNLMICRAVKDPKDLIVCSEQELSEYIDSASRYSMNYILEVLNVLGDTVSNLRKGLNRRVEMEMAIIKLCGNNVESVVQTPSAQVTHPTPQRAQTVSAQPPVVQSPITQAPVEHTDTVPTATAAQTATISLAENVKPVETTDPAENTEPIMHTELTPAIVAQPQPSEAKNTVVDSEPAAQVMPDDSINNYVSLKDTIPDGLIPTNTWNAIVREVVNTDKLLIGTMNSAKAYKKGNSLLIFTDNVLLKRFVPVDSHRQNIYNATFTVLGEYLNPVITEEEPDEFSNENTEQPVQTAQINAAEVKQESTAEYAVASVTGNAPETPQNAAAETIPNHEETNSTADTSPKDADPLDAFINNIKNDSQIDFSLFIEE